MSGPKLVYSGETVRLTDLVLSDQPSIDGVTFEDCRIEGPAVMVFEPYSGTTLSDCDLGGEPVGLFWHIPAERDYVIGGLFVRNCRFHRCTFHGVGMAGHDEFLNQLILGTVE